MTFPPAILCGCGGGGITVPCYPGVLPTAFIVSDISVDFATGAEVFLERYPIHLSIHIPTTFQPPTLSGSFYLPRSGNPEACIWEDQFPIPFQIDLHSDSRRYEHATGWKCNNVNMKIGAFYDTPLGNLHLIFGISWINTRLDYFYDVNILTGQTELVATYTQELGVTDSVEAVISDSSAYPFVLTNENQYYPNASLEYIAYDYGDPWPGNQRFVYPYCYHNSSLNSTHTRRGMLLHSAKITPVFV